jgi:hypothetical protein
MVHDEEALVLLSFYPFCLDGNFIPVLILFLCSLSYYLDSYSNFSILLPVLLFVAQELPDCSF